ncbi:MAG: methyltransferase [Leptospiraceae bacterium]|nr:MAG: methyltransferase [Leptospiraceae bacterium]
MYKDLFSKQSKLYAKYRPYYPEELYHKIYNLMEEHKIPYDIAWDCATGNGQVAIELAKRFKLVFATDISKNQILNAPKKKNIIYKIESVEENSLKDKSINLITVAQAFHWFNHEIFFKEIIRVSKKPAIIAIWCYGLLNVEKEIFELFFDLYENKLGNYWEMERKLVENGYQNINFPFDIRREQFDISLKWNKEYFLGYLSSWSSVQKFIEKNHSNPLDEFKQRIDKYWKDDEFKIITFPIYFIYGIL